MKMQLLLEELCFKTVIPMVKGRPVMKVSFEVNDNNEAGDDNEDIVSMTVTYAGEDKDPLAGADEISRSLINSACRKLEFVHKNGSCSVNITV